MLAVVRRAAVLGAVVLATGCTLGLAGLGASDGDGDSPVASYDGALSDDASNGDDATSRPGRPSAGPDAGGHPQPPTLRSPTRRTPPPTPPAAERVRRRHRGVRHRTQRMDACRLRTRADVALSVGLRYRAKRGSRRGTERGERLRMRRVHRDPGTHVRRRRDRRRVRHRLLGHMQQGGEPLAARQLAGRRVRNRHLPGELLELRRRSTRRPRRPAERARLPASRRTAR